MKTKNSDISVKIFLVVVAVILVGLIISWSTGVFKDKKNDLNDGTARINNALGSVAEFDLLFYDGGSINGEALIDLIKTVAAKEPGLTITVKTLAAIKSTSVTPISYKGGSPAFPTNKDDGNYINPIGKFKGEVTRDANDIITGITFTQY